MAASLTTLKPFLNRSLSKRRPRDHWIPRNAVCLPESTEGHRPQPSSLLHISKRIGMQKLVAAAVLDLLIAHDLPRRRIFLLEGRRLQS